MENLKKKGRSWAHSTRLGELKATGYQQRAARNGKALKTAREVGELAALFALRATRAACWLALGWGSLAPALAWKGF